MRLHRLVVNRLERLKRLEGKQAVVVGGLMVLSAILLLFNYLSKNGSSDPQGSPDIVHHILLPKTWIEILHFLSIPIFLMTGFKFMLRRYDAVYAVHRVVSRNRPEIYAEIRIRDEWPGVQIRPCSEQTLATLTEIGDEAFGGRLTAHERHDMYSRWHRGHPSCFKLVYYRRELVGYVSVLPLNTWSAVRHLRGDLSQYSFIEDDISRFGANHIYINAIYIRKEHIRCRGLFPAVLRAVAELVAEFCADDLDDLVIYAEAFTPAGTHLLRDLGFHRDGLSKDEKPFYRLDWRRKETASLAAKSTIDLISDIVRTVRDESPPHVGRG